MADQNVANIALAHYEQGKAEAAANALVTRAAQLWQGQMKMIDNITCIVIFFSKNLILDNIQPQKV